MDAAASEPARGERISRGALWAGAAAVAALVLALRVPALGTELWLDEIWSWDMARRAGSALEIFWAQAFNHDNNHRLNTLWLYAVGPDAPPPVLRLLAFACGLGTVPLAGLVAARHSRTAALLAALLVGASFFLGVYGTEARGYAPALFFALAALALLHRILDAVDARGALPPGSVAAFQAACLLGLLAHLSFAHFLLGALPWSALRLVRAQGGGRRAALRLAALHGPVLAAAAAWGAVRVASMHVGGGPSLPWSETLDATLAWTFGLPTSRVPVALGLAAWAALVAAGLVRQARAARDRDAWILYAGVVLAAPVLSVAAAREGFFYPRYLLLPAAFSLLLAAPLLAGVAARGRGGATLAAGLALLFVAGNAHHALAFAERGRHGTRAAMVTLARQTPGDGPVRFAAQWPTWAQLALRYHAGLFAGRGVELRGPRALERRGTGDLDWLVLQAAGPLPPDPPAVQPLEGTRFALRHAFDCYGPSCVHWLLYAREAP